MNREILIEPLTPDAFALYGDVIDIAGEPTVMINNGKCGRYHDRATLDFDDRGHAGISVFEGQPYALPHTLSLVERHPLGSQAFIPMSDAPFLVIVADDVNGVPGRPKAFLTERKQGVNIHRGVWHGVLTPLDNPALFAVVDWISDTPNLQEHNFDVPWSVSHSDSNG